MKVFFALDISCGFVVRGSKGEREKYKRVGDVQTVLKRFDPKRVYVADLDRIEGKGDNLRVIEDVSRSRETIVDLGLREPQEVEELRIPAIPILATETFDIRKISSVKTDYYVSLDFKGGFLSTVSLDSALEILNTVKTVVIVLTIDRVGTLNPNFDLLDYVLERSENPVMAGGGIRSIEDLENLKERGCYGSIIATAVYKNLIPVEVVRRGVF